MKKIIGASDIVRGTWENTDQGNALVVNGQRYPMTKVGRSGNREMGLGLFASKPFARGEYVGFYAGRDVTENEQAREGDYVIEYTRPVKDQDVQVFVDAKNTPESKGDVHMVNDAGFASGSAYDPEKNNAFFTDYGFVRALKELKEGDEIFVSYGEDYWKDDLSIVRLLGALFVGVDVRPSVFTRSLLIDQLSEESMSEEREASESYWNQKQTAREV